MKVVVAAAGTWHAPQLASEVHRANALSAVVTTTPASRFRRRQTLPLPRGKIRIARGSLLAHQLAGRVHFGSRPLVGVAENAWARTLSRVVREHEPEVLAVFARFALEAFYENAHTLRILERGSWHVRARESALQDEADRIGVLRAVLPEPVVERELEEYELADVISVPSTTAATSFRDWGVPESKLMVVRYGVDEQRFHVGEKVHPASKRIVLSVGNLGLEKGLHRLLQAADTVRTPFELRLVGRVDVEILRRFMPKNEYCTVTLVGQIGPDQLADEYRSADIYCLPSVQEGLSLTLLEAAACGTYVIATAATGVDDLHLGGDRSATVDTSPGSLGSLLQDALMDDELMRRARDAALSSAPQFSWGSYGSAWIAALTKAR